MKKDKDFIVTVDLGGTNIRVALVSTEGNIVALLKRPSNASKGHAYVIKTLERDIEYIISKSNKNIEDIECISAAIAGINDMKNSIVTTAPNLPGWKKVNLQKILADRFNLPVYLINDATAAAIAEHGLGAGKGYKHLIYLTVSTGIGGGIIIDNKPYYGADGTAGELGHMKIMVDGPKCHCGKNGCLEALVSGYAMANRAITAIEKGRDTILKTFYYDGAGSLTAEKISGAARQGDVLANEIVSEAAHYLGIGLSNIINIFNPEIIVIGGGLSKMGRMLLIPAEKIARQTAFKLPASTVKIVKSKRGDTAGIIGAAIAVSKKYRF
jgi:glucokinase